MKKTMALLMLAAMAGGCASYGYADTNAAVDADPACASRPDRPGEPVSISCQRKAEASWSSRRDSTPVDFSRRPKDD